MESPQRLTVEEQLVASQEQLAASHLEIARLSAAQNGADARGDGSAAAAPQHDENARGGGGGDAAAENARGGGEGDAAAEQDAHARSGGGGYLQPARDWDKSSSRAGSVFNTLPPTPPRGRVGSFGDPHPNSQWAGLSTTWHAALTDNHAKADKVFNPREPAQLAKLESNGRRLLQLQQDLRDCVNALSPDNEAVVYMLDFNDELEIVLDSIRGVIDDYTLRWNHPIRYEAIRRFTGYYEQDKPSGPTCMLDTNLNLEYQITLSDLKAIKKEVKQDPPRGGGGGRGARESRGGGRAGGDASQARNRRKRQGAATGAASNQGLAQSQCFGIVFFC